MKVFWGVGIIGIVAGCGAAVAQSGYPERRFDVTLSARTTYDSNIARRGALPPSFPDDDRRVRGDDVRFSPQAQLDIIYPLSRQAIFFNGVIGYDFHARNSQLNRERINLAAGADLRFAASCGTRLTGEYVRRQSDLADLIGLGRLVNTEEIKAFEAQANCGDAYGLQPGVGYRHEVADNSAIDRRRNNYRSDSFNAQLAYVRPTFGSLSIFSTLRNTVYPNRTITPAGVEDEVEFYTIGGRYEREIGSRLRGAVSVGYTKVDPKLASTPGFSGLSYSADLTYQPTERLRLDLAASREAQVSNLLDTSYSIDTTYSLDGQYALNERLRLLFGTSYSERDLTASPLVPAEFRRTGDKTYIGYVGAVYDLNDRMSFDVNFTQQRRDSNISFFDYKSTQVSAGVNLKL